MTMKQCGVYKIANTITGDFYIGSSNDVRDRMQRHRRELSKNVHTNQHLQRAFNKYGEQAFEFKALLLCDIENKLYYEQVCIDALKPAYNLAINAAAPGQGRHHSEETKRKLSKTKSGENNPNFGKNLSEERKRKISDWNRGKVISDEARKKISASLTGHTVSDETRAKISASQTGRTVSEGTRAKIGKVHAGTHHSEETKRKISEKEMGKIVSEETREKLSNAHVGAHHSQETRAKMSQSQKLRRALEKESN